MEKHIKNILIGGGRDSEWISILLRAGLLAGSFIPGKRLREFHGLNRYRKSVIRDIIPEKQGREIPAKLRPKFPSAALPSVDVAPLRHLLLPCRWKFILRKICRYLTAGLPTPDNILFGKVCLICLSFKIKVMARNPIKTNTPSKSDIKRCIVMMVCPSLQCTLMCAVFPVSCSFLYRLSFSFPNRFLILAYFHESVKASIGIFQIVFIAHIMNVPAIV